LGQTRRIFQRKVDLLTISSIKNPFLEKYRRYKKFYFMTESKSCPDVLMAITLIANLLLRLPISICMTKTEKTQSAVERQLVLLGSIK
jgi:hypothetical protein